MEDTRPRSHAQTRYRWKIEALCVYNAAGAVVCGDPHLHPIKHVTSKYLIANESRLEVLIIGYYHYRVWGF